MQVATVRVEKSEKYPKTRRTSSLGTPLKDLTVMHYDYLIDVLSWLEHEWPTINAAYRSFTVVRRMAERYKAWRRTKTQKG
jgi:hypothetical protein